MDFMSTLPAATSSNTSSTPTPSELKLVCIVRCPRSASYGLLRTADHPALLFAVNLHGFLRRTPFDGVLFRVEDGKLVAEGYE